MVMPTRLILPEPPEFVCVCAEFIVASKRFFINLA
jgi:hypothetical protein